MKIDYRFRKKLEQLALMLILQITDFDAFYTIKNERQKITQLEKARFIKMYKLKFSQNELF